MMLPVLRYAKDLKPGDQFRHPDIPWTVVAIKELMQRCEACGSDAVPKIRIDLGGAYLVLPAKEVVEMIEAADTYQAKREELAAAIARGE